MASSWLILIAAGSGVLWVAVGIVLGYYARTMKATIVRLNQEINHANDRITGLEAEEEPDTAIIETTPRVLADKKRKGGSDDDDSAIITVKTPAEIRQAKDKSFDEFIQGLQGHS